MALLWETMKLKQKIFIWQSFKGFLGRSTSPELAAPAPAWFALPPSPSACSLSGVKSAPFFGGGVPVFMVSSFPLAALGLMVGHGKNLKLDSSSMVTWKFELSFELFRKAWDTITLMGALLKSCPLNRLYIYILSIGRPSEYIQFIQKKTRKPSKYHHSWAFCSSRTVP